MQGIERLRVRCDHEKSSVAYRPCWATASKTIPRSALSAVLMPILCLEVRCSAVLPNAFGVLPPAVAKPQGFSCLSPKSHNRSSPLSASAPQLFTGSQNAKARTHSLRSEHERVETPFDVRPLLGVPKAQIQAAKNVHHLHATPSVAILRP